MPFTFLDPKYLALILLVLPMLAFWFRRQNTVSHSNIAIQANLRSLSLIPRLPGIAFALAWTLICLALAQPALTHVTEHQTMETRDIIMSVDISGSMMSTISNSEAGATPGWCLQYGCPVATLYTREPVSASTQPAKLDLARQSVKYFVSQRKGDRIGLMAFDDETYYMWPLSSDEQLVANRTALLDKPGGGTDFAGVRGPIQSALDHFQQYSTARTKILILVTDGGASMSPDRSAQLLKQMEQLGVRMYVLGVGDEWTGSKAITNDLRNFIAANHGTIVNAGSADEMQAAIEQINQTEKSNVELQRDVAYHNIYPPFVAASLMFWVLFLLFNAATRRTS